MDETATILLEPAERELWAEYLALLDRGLRKKALSALDEFVRGLESYPAERRSAWVAAVCRSLLDQTKPHGMKLFDTWIRYPLFSRIVLPELRNGYTQGLPHHARWIGQLRHRIYVAKEACFQELGLSPNDFLREALRMDPTDSAARRELISNLAEQLDYFVHEVPRGVLANSQYFRARLDEFWQLVTDEGLTERYEEAYRYWQLHCDAWEGYLSHRAQFTNYADYLAGKRTAD